MYYKLVIIILLTFSLLLLLPSSKAIYNYSRCDEWSHSGGHPQCYNLSVGQQTICGGGLTYNKICHDWSGDTSPCSTTTKCFPFCYGSTTLAKIRFRVSGFTYLSDGGWYNISVCGVKKDINYVESMGGCPSLPTGCSCDPFIYPYTWISCNFTVSSSCSPYNITLFDEWEGSGSSFGIQDISFQCYSGGENWSKAVCPESHYIPATTECGQLGLCFDNVLCFFASVPEFIINLIICVQPIFILMFGLAIAGVIVLIMKKSLG